MLSVSPTGCRGHGIAVPSGLMHAPLQRINKDDLYSLPHFNALQTLNGLGLLPFDLQHYVQDNFLHKGILYRE